MKNLIAILSVIFFLYSCSGNKEENLPGIHFQEISEKCILNLSDLGSDFRAVKLETGPDILLDARTKFYIANKHIVCCTRTKLLQFSTDGSFIRTLATNGIGPDEYEMIVEGAFNSDETLFFFYDYSDNGISVINLENGQREEKIYLAKSEKAKTFSLINDNRLAIMKHKSEASDYMVYYQDMASQFTGGVLAPENQNSIPFGQTNPMILYNNGLIYFNNAVGGDTLYSLENNKAEKLLYLDAGQKVDYEETLDGFYTIVVMLSGDRFIFRNVSWGMRTENGFDMVRILGSKLYSYDMQGAKAEEITAFRIDLLGQEYFDNKLNDLFGNIFVNHNSRTLAVKINSLELLKMRNEGMEFEKLQIALEELSESDNPILLIGKLK